MNSYYSHEPTELDQKKYSKYLEEDEELELVTGYGESYLIQRFIEKLIFPGLIFILIFIPLTLIVLHNLILALFLGIILDLAYTLLIIWKIESSHRYILTNKRIMVKQGSFDLKIKSVMYDKIIDIDIDQSLTDRLFLRQGTVIIKTSGEFDELVLSNVEHPFEFKDILDKLIHLQKKFEVEEENKEKSYISN